MQVKRLFAIFIVLFSLSLPGLSQAQRGRPKVVSIPDKNLAAAIRQEIGNPITTHTLLNLTRLDVRNRGIKNLTGLEHARNLEELNLGNKHVQGKGFVNSNKISNFSPIAGLTNLKTLNLSDCSLSDVSFLVKLRQLERLGLYHNLLIDISVLVDLTQLTELNLGGNNISDISALVELKQLNELRLWRNNISDISPLVELKQLTELNLGDNNISDISALAELKQLTELNLGDNNISDISPLAELKQLNELNLGDNNISDISALAELKQLTSLELGGDNILHVVPLGSTPQRDNPKPFISENLLNYISINTHIPAMQAKGVVIKFAPRMPTTLTKRLGDAQQGKPGQALPTPLVVEVKDEKGIPFAGVPVKFSVTTGGGRIRLAQVVSDATGRAETILTLGPRFVKNTVRVTAPKIQQPVTFTATATDNPPPIFRKPTTFSVVENTTAVGTVKAVDIDKQDKVTGYTIRSLAGEDNAKFSITPTGVLRFKTPPDYERPTTASRTNEYIVLVSATSGTGKRTRTGTQPFTIIVTDIDEPPDVPTAPTVIPATPESVIVSWVAPTNTGPPMTYQVRYREGNTSKFINTNYNGAETNFTLSGLRRETRYQIQVRARNDEGISAWSPSGVGIPKTSPSVDFRDAALRSKIAEALGKRRNASITALDMLELTKLEAPNANIRDLTGIEHARNLEELNLGGEYIEGKGSVNSNTVSNFSPLARLTNLRSLNLSRCSISDVSFLARLTQLRTLSLYSNPISDISPLAGLTQLKSLYLSSVAVSDLSPLAGLTQLIDLSLDNNSISDFSPLAGLTQLKYLYLRDNSISDISPLAGLTQLKYLYLWGNSISDISALSGLTQLTTLDLSNNDILDVSPLVRLDLTLLYIERNPLSYASINTHIPAMQAKGIEVKFDNRIPTAFLKSSGIAQQGIVNTAVPLPFVVEVLDEEDQAFAGVPVKFTITDGGGKLSATTVRTDATGKAAAHLRMGRTVGTTTVRVTAANISQPVQFTAMAILRSASVTIPDANLRAKIAGTLGKPFDGTLTAADMLTLKTLTANNADILDLTGMQHAANLTTLSLNNNRISNVTLLVGLTRLTTLDLRNNRISDVSPLVRLTQSRGTKDWNALHLQGNPLSDTSIRAHIPVLQAAGVNVRFDSVSTQSRPIVRLVYFLPRDRHPQPDINAKMNRLIKDVHQFYTKQMGNHGFGGKTFQFETDPHGNAVVYHINGKFDDTYYHDKSGVAWREINEQFNRSKNIYLTALDISTERIGTGEGDTACGTGGGGSHSGGALIPASGHCFDFQTAAHELGHAFGLFHDFRSDAYIMSYGGASRTELSQCTAEWLDVHRSFSPNQITSDNRPTIEMLPPSLASPPNAIRLRFKVNDPDGLHQAQLHTTTLSGAAEGSPELVAYQRLNGDPNHTVNLVTSYLVPENKSVSLHVIDVHGNISGSESFPVDIPSLLPRSRVVSIPDANLATAIREEIGDSITTHTMLNLTHLDVHNNGIRDLTGLEHAHNLRELNLGAEYLFEGPANSNVVSNFSPLARLTNLRTLHLAHSSLSDISTLAALTQLTYLNLWDNSISDISALSGLTQLTRLDLVDNDISDISALSGLTQLTRLALHYNDISDISALSGLTQLTRLALHYNDISDISALSGLIQLTHLELSDNDISDISALSGLTQLTYLHLGENAISDISVLEGLTQLTALRLSNNGITDVSPLVGLNLTGEQGGHSSTGLFIKNNPLSYTSINTHIPAMQAKGVKVVFDDRTPTTFVKISGTAQQGVVNSELPLPFVVEVRDEQNRAFAEVPVTFSITAGRGRLSNTTITTDTTGKAETRLTLGPTAGTITVNVSAAKISQSVQFTATAVLINTPVTVSDAALHAAITSVLNKSPSSDLTMSDMLKLTTLTANGANIRDLTGLQHASNLTALSLNNNLSDIAPIAGLSQLTTLSLNGNRISDVTPLAALTQLKTLSLENNNLADVTPLSDLTQLTTLLLDDNRLSDVVPLTGLSQLRTLSLNNNDISEVAPLISLTQLKTLQLKGNLLSYPALHTHVPTIQAGGATVAIDLRTPTTLVKVSGTHGVAGRAISIIAEVQDEQGLGFAGVPVTFTVTAGGGHVTASKVIADITGRARTTFTLGETPGKNIVRAVVVGGRQRAIFSITAINEASTVTVSDANLRARITESIGKSIGTQLTAGDMLKLMKLEGSNANIQHLTGLEHAHNLRELDLGSEYIREQGFVNSNSVSDISALSGLMQLKDLDLSDNSISDISALSGLTQLETLWISDSTISDISALSGLTQLTHLNLQYNEISDISALSGLTQLVDLALFGNSISDVSALSGLTQLTMLSLSNNKISDVLPLVGLNLTGTQRQSTGLYIGWNPLSYASINTHIPAMQAKGVEVEFDNRAHSALVKISGDTQEASPGAVLTTPFVVEAMNARGKPMQGVSVTFAVTSGKGYLSTRTATTNTAGQAQTTLTLGRNPGKHTVTATATKITRSILTFTAIAVGEPLQLTADVNSDGVVNIQDLVLVSSNFGQTGQNQADVNGDGVVNISDLVLVAGAFGEGAASAPSLHLSDLEGLTTAKLQDLLTQARQMALTDPIYLRGILVLEQLLASLFPKETALLVNYPNPFNPETWIPYQLAKPAEVTLHIYAVDGRVVKRLALGHQPAGMYHSKSRAAYWDGRNAQGERVASGIYFYTLSVGDFTATRKMLIRK